MACPELFQMMYCLDTGGAKMFVAAEALLNFRIAYTDWFNDAVDIGPLREVKSWLVEVIVTVLIPAIAVSKM